MPEAEREQTFTTKERPLTRRQMRSATELLAAQAVREFTFLGEVETSFDLERSQLRDRVIGQESAIEAIINSLDRSEVRRDDDHRPIANLAFLGPTGVGKTQAAKALAYVTREYNPRLLRIDCSQYSQGHEVAALIGSPPGYVGRKQMPVLDPSEVEGRGVVVLFDEIEKGSPELYNLMLQIMDNGLLTLNNGEVTSFREATVIMTSNLGAKEMASRASGKRTGFSVQEEALDKSALEEVALKSFKDFFSPEFVNRLDNMVVFHPLDSDALHEVLRSKVNELNEFYVDRFGAYLSLSEMTREHLVAAALDQPEFGARPLVRQLEKEVAGMFGRYNAADKIPNGSEVYVYHRDEVADHLHATYKPDLVFAIRPDETVRMPEPSTTGTQVVPYAPLPQGTL